MSAIHRLTLCPHSSPLPSQEEEEEEMRRPTPGSKLHELEGDSTHKRISLY